MSPGERKVEIYDTTLRDGTQREGISLSMEDKLAIARRLDALGVAFIEAGWPGSNPKDAEVFAHARSVAWKHAALTAFGATRRVGCAPADDPSLAAVLAAGTPVVTIFGKTWTLHVEEVLRTTRDENLRLIEDTVAYLRGAGRRVIYDAEHFFDGFDADPGYALATLAAAARGGAETIVLCDTNGGSLPWRIERATERVQRSDVLGGRTLGIHAHDDSGCGVANTLAAVRAGARHVQGTLNGWGERCGNANLCAIIPDLELKMGLSCLPDGGLARLRDAAGFAAEVANLAPDDHMAYVGRSAFAHKGGVHVAAIRRSPRSYEHIDPTLVGNETRVVVSELSGRGNVLSKAEEHGVALGGGAETGVLEAIKVAEARGWSYEAAEGSVALLLRRRAADYRPPFRLLDYKVLVAPASAEATVKLEVGGRVVHTAAEGVGPVAALDGALRKALPQAGKIQLHDYKVRILDGAAGTAAVTRVLITAGDGDQTWSTVGASTNIIEASWLALADAVEYGLLVADKAKREREREREREHAKEERHESEDRPSAR
jgi:2-isopropylmalate synthase